MSGAKDSVEWLAPAGPDGVRIGRSDARIVVQWPGFGQLSYSNSGNDAEFTAVEGASALALEKFRLTSLLACRRYLAGKLSLHASAVALPRGGSVVLVGDSGAGKSTTAMALVEQHGGTFLADDVVPIDWVGSAPVVCPVEDSFWLNADASAWFGVKASSTEKRACSPRVRSVGPERLRAIVQLVFDETGEDAALDPVTGRDAFTILSGAHVCYPTGGDEETIQNFAARARLADATRVFRLRRRRTLQILPLVAQLLEERLSE